MCGVGERGAWRGSRMCGVNREQQVIAENEPQNGGCEDPTELLTAGDLARRLRVSLRQVRKLHSEALLPVPIRLGRSMRWRGSEVGKWIEMGCPSRERWEQRQAAESVGNKNK